MGVHGVVVNAYSRNKLAGSLFARSLANSASHIFFAREAAFR